MLANKTDVVCIVSGLWLCIQWRNQRGGALGAAAPPSRELELHCILLLHNFTVHWTRNCN